MRKYHSIVIGVDQSYQRTGVSIAADGDLKSVRSIDYHGHKSKTEKRAKTRAVIEAYCRMVCERFTADELVLVLERTRQFSDGFLSVPYIKSMGALNASIVDTASSFGFECFSVDTRAWKSGVIGTSKPMDNEWGINPKKWPTIEWMRSNYPGFLKQNMHPASKAKKKGVIELKSGRYTVDDDACDSACIALSWSCLDPSKFLAEE